MFVKTASVNARKDQHFSWKQTLKTLDEPVQSLSVAPGQCRGAVCALEPSPWVVLVMPQ